MVAYLRPQPHTAGARRIRPETKGAAKSPLRRGWSGAREDEEEQGGERHWARLSICETAMRSEECGWSNHTDCGPQAMMGPRVIGAVFGQFSKKIMRSCGAWSEAWAVRPARILGVGLNIDGRRCLYGFARFRAPTDAAKSRST